MLKKLKKKARSQSVSVPLTKENFPLETFKQLIEEDLIQDEIPFEFLAEQYPDLLDEWYPGYPGRPRMMTSDDPMPLIGYIKNGAVSFQEFPDLGPFPIDAGIDPSVEGERRVWLRREKDSFFVHVVVSDKQL